MRRLQNGGFLLAVLVDAVTLPYYKLWQIPSIFLPIRQYGIFLLPDIQSVSKMLGQSSELSSPQHKKEKFLINIVHIKVARLNQKTC